MSREVLAVIGGSGLYDLEGFEVVEEIAVETPYGAPSDAVVKVRNGDHTVLFLPRHGRGHDNPPHAINYRANICALKKLGATQVLSVSAVGSLRERLAPGDLLVVDQFVDWTRRRISTFFDQGAVAHVSVADPVCPYLGEAVYETAREVFAALPDGAPTLHRGGTYICMEGPQFSTRAESELYRSWGMDIIGMTNMPEAKLAREAELPYVTLALVTDYDCWHEGEEAVDIGSVIARLKTMIEHAKRVVAALPARLPDASASPAARALEGAVMTARDAMAPEAREQLAWLLDD